MNAPEPIALAPAEAWLRLQGLSKRFAAYEALKGVDLDISEGEFICLLGPSGCGKTTLLRILAGLETADAGQLSRAGLDIGRLPPARRDYGMVFQSYALFPNLTVAENIAYGLRLRGVHRRHRVRELLDLVGLPGRDDYLPAQLSGGQQQRVALARALASSPSLLLLDEPLSALDARVREHLRQELRALQRKLGITTLMVTHDQDEAFALADRVAVMHEGRIVQLGTPQQLYAEPAERFVAEFIGQANWLSLRCADDGWLEWQGKTLPWRGALLGLAPGQRGQALCRPEDLLVTDAPWTPEQAPVLADVESVGFCGPLSHLSLRLSHAPQQVLRASLPAHDPLLHSLRPGRRLVLGLRIERLRLFRDD
jgi:iron(III) transport system ATP-binding protein